MLRHQRHQHIFEPLFPSSTTPDCVAVVELRIGRANFGRNQGPQWLPKDTSCVLLGYRGSGLSYSGQQSQTLLFVTSGVSARKQQWYWRLLKFFVVE